MADVGRVVGAAEPSLWLARHSDLLPRGARVLDVAAGGGRHTRWLLARGCRVVAVDRDAAALRGIEGATVVEADLEGGAWPFVGELFGGVVVTNYLWRPLLPVLVAAVAPGGALLYETFARGHERFGRPRNPAFLLAPGELLDAVRGELEVVAYEHATVGQPPHALVQRIAARRLG